MSLYHFSTELHPELQGAVRSTTVWVESQLVTDGKVVTGSWCRMCCSRELSRSSVTPGCTLGCTVQYTLYTLYTLDTWPSPGPGGCRQFAATGLLSPASQWRPQHLSSSASVRQRLGWLSDKKKPSLLLFEKSIWLCGNSLLSNQLCILLSLYPQLLQLPVCCLQTTVTGISL